MRSARSTRIRTLNFKHLVFLTYAGFQKLAAYSLVHTNGLGYLLHISPGGLTQSTDAVDAADSLSQECIGCLHGYPHTRKDHLKTTMEII